MNFHSYLIKSPIPMATILWPLPPLSTCRNSLFSVHWTLSRSSNTESYKLYTSCKYGKHTTHNINSIKFTISHPWITFVHMTVCLFSYFCLFVKFSSVQWLQIKCSKDLKKSEGHQIWIDTALKSWKISHLIPSSFSLNTVFSIRR